MWRTKALRSQHVPYVCLAVTRLLYKFPYLACVLPASNIQHHLRCDSSAIASPMPWRTLLAYLELVGEGAPTSFEVLLTPLP